MIKDFCEIALLFLTMGVFFLFGYQLGYNHGIRDGIKMTLEVCNAMKETILDLAFGEAKDETEEIQDQK